MCLVMISFGAVRISGAVENRDRSREAAQNLAEKTENYIKLSAELDSSPVDYGEVSEEQTERRDKYDSDNSKHRADVAEYTATKGGTAMGSLALDEAAYAIQVGWESLDCISSKLPLYFSTSERVCSISAPSSASCSSLGSSSSRKA